MFITSSLPESRVKEYFCNFFLYFQITLYDVTMILKKRAFGFI